MDVKSLSRLLRNKMMKTPEVEKLERNPRDLFWDRCCKETPWCEECKIYEI